jgi:hypothetical protein
LSIVHVLYIDMKNEKQSHSVSREVSENEEKITEDIYLLLKFKRKEKRNTYGTLGRVNADF